MSFAVGLSMPGLLATYTRDLILSNT